jgi:type VI secretion system protein ImpJ
MFLRPQHFQQQDRFVGALVRGRCRHLRTFDWGITRLVLDQGALELGRLVITECRGVLPDGTPINIPDEDDSPPAFEVPPDLRDARIMLGLPLRRVGRPAVDREENTERVTRYRTAQTKLRDANVQSIEEEVDIEVGKRRLRLLAERSPEAADYATIGVARVKLRQEQKVTLDENYLPPCLDCQGVVKLAGYLKEIQGMLHQQGEQSADLVRGGIAEQVGVADIAHFLYLQVINRFEPLFAHLARTPGLHPEELYQAALQLAGELSTIISETRRPAVFKAYNHDDLETTFIEVMGEIRKLLVGLPTRAVKLPLVEHKTSTRYRVSPISDRTLIADAHFVLAVKAEMPIETLRDSFPKQSKIGPAERIGELVRLNLPAINLRPLPHAPREIPYYTDFVYYELERSGKFWEEMQKSAAFVLHIGGNYPGIELAFWAIKR